MTNQIVEQANKLNAVCNMSAFNSTGLQELKKIADRYNDISSDFEMTEKNGKIDQYYDNENKTLDEEKNDKDTQKKIVYLNHLKYKVLSSRGDDSCG